MSQTDNEWPSGTLRSAWLVAASCGVLILVALCVGPMRNAVEIGLDEHYELTKALLWSRGFSLYRQVWSDQPPLFTVVLGLCFRLFGESIAVARAAAGFFGLSMVAACWAIMARRCGAFVAAIGAALLLAAPQVLWLCASAMQEVPAIGTALWALWAILRWQEHRRWHWLALSGAVLALALQLKLTAIVMVPAIIGEILLTTFPEGPPGGRKRVHALGIWVGSALLAFGMTVAVVGTIPFHLLQSTHFSASVTSIPVASVRGVAYWPILASLHPDALLTTGIGLVFLFLKHDSRRLAFSLVTLLMVTVLYLFQRPFWEYYYLHVALPLAWLGAYAIAEALRRAAALPLWTWRSWKVYLSTSLLLALVAGFGGKRLFQVTREMSALPRVPNSRLVDAMRQHAKGTRFVFTQSTIYAFHARLALVPELSALSKKRFWSGQITSEQIWSIVRRYRPEQLLLKNEPLEPGVGSWIDSEYFRSYYDDEYSLYVLKHMPSGSD